VIPGDVTVRLTGLALLVVGRVCRTELAIDPVTLLRHPQASCMKCFPLPTLEGTLNAPRLFPWV
jgi:hypothetical protein